MEGGDVPPGYVCLVSCDKHEFLIERKYAEVSKLVKRTLESKVSTIWPRNARFRL